MLYVKFPLAQADEVGIPCIGHHVNATHIIVNEMAVRTNPNIPGETFEEKVSLIEGEVLSNPEARNIINTQNFALCLSNQQ